MHERRPLPPNLTHHHDAAPTRGGTCSAGEVQQCRTDRGTETEPASPDVPACTDEQQALVGNRHICQIGQPPHSVEVVEFVGEAQFLRMHPAPPQDCLSLAQARNASHSDGGMAPIARQNVRIRCCKLARTDKQRLQASAFLPPSTYGRAGNWYRRSSRYPSRWRCGGHLIGFGCQSRVSEHDLPVYANALGRRA